MAILNDPDQNEDSSQYDEYAEIFLMPLDFRKKKTKQIWTKLIVLDFISCFLLISGLVLMLIEVISIFLSWGVIFFFLQEHMYNTRIEYTIRTYFKNINRTFYVIVYV